MVGMVRSRAVLLLLLALAVLLVAPSGPAVGDTTVTAHLTEANHSGVTGTATLSATSGGGLRVVIRARGLVPGVPHAQHVHGTGGGGHFMCPSGADDTNGDGLLTNEEASGEYGNVFLALTTRGDASAKSGLDLARMPVADTSGRLTYDRTFSAAELPDGLVKYLSDAHVVQHGIDVNHNGRYDVAGAGISTFAKNLGVPGVPEEVTDPASCGMVTGARTSIPPRGGMETGGGPGGSVNVPVGALGGLLLVGSLVAYWRVTRGRGPTRG